MVWSRRQVLGALGFAVLLVGGVYGYNVKRNVDAQRSVEASCASLRRAIDDVARSTDALAARLLPERGEELVAAIRATPEPLCRDLNERLEWHRWNLGVAYQPPAERPEELGALLDAARARCPPVMREIFREAGVPEARVDLQAVAACDRALELPQPAPARADRELGAWAWAGVLETAAEAADLLHQRFVDDRNRAQE